jgi:hypothetical protein
VGETGVSRAARPALLVLMALACGDAGDPAADTARVDFVDGALEPIVVPGQRVLIQGFGFGDIPGDVRFTTPSGGTAATVLEWTPQAIVLLVPATAVSGEIIVVTAEQQLSAQVHVLPPVAFDPGALAWAPRPPLPAFPFGVALAAAERPGTDSRPTIFAAGGGEPVGGDSVIVPDSAVYATRADAGTLTAWVRQHDDRDRERHRGLPAARAFAAAAAATRYNSPVAGGVLYVLGGVDATGRAHATVYAAEVDADSLIGPFVAIEPLPMPVWGATALVRRGRLYVIGGADSVGRPHRRVFVGRVAPDGRIDGWYEQPPLTGPRALGGGVVLDRAVAVFGGVADSVPPGGGLDDSPPRMVTSDTAPLSLASGFLRGPWIGGPAFLLEGRSQFTTLWVGDHVLLLGGMYAGAASNSAELLAARWWPDSVSAFAAVAPAAPIHSQGGGTLVGAAGATWRAPDGTFHGLIVGGMDLVTRQSTTRCWGF